MHEEDPTWIVEQSKELKQTIVSGQGEFHLRTLKWRIENNDKLPIDVRRTAAFPIARPSPRHARADYRHKKAVGRTPASSVKYISSLNLITEGMPAPDSISNSAIRNSR